MNPALANALARIGRQLTTPAARTPTPPEVRFGTVISVSGARLTVQIGGNGTDIPDVPRLASYTSPTAGDRVALLRHDDDLLCIGKLA